MSHSLGGVSATKYVILGRFGSALTPPYQLCVDAVNFLELLHVRCVSFRELNMHIVIIPPDSCLYSPKYITQSRLPTTRFIDRAGDRAHSDRSHSNFRMERQIVWGVWDGRFFARKGRRG